MESRGGVSRVLAPQQEQFLSFGHPAQHRSSLCQEELGFRSSLFVRWPEAPRMLLVSCLQLGCSEPQTLDIPGSKSLEVGLGSLWVLSARDSAVESTFLTSDPVRSQGLPHHQLPL